MLGTLSKVQSRLRKTLPDAHLTKDVEVSEAEIARPTAYSKSRQGPPSCNSVTHNPSLTDLINCYPVFEKIASYLIINDVRNLSLINKHARQTLAPTGSLSTSVVKAAMKCSGAQVLDISTEGDLKPIQVSCQAIIRNGQYCAQCGEVVCTNCRFGSTCWLRVQDTRLKTFANEEILKHTLISRCSKLSYSLAQHQFVKARAKLHCKRHSAASKKALKDGEECNCQLDFPWTSQWLCTLCVNNEILKLSDSCDHRRTSTSKARCSYIDPSTGDRCSKNAREFSVKQCQLCTGLVGPLHPKTLFACCCLQFVGICGMAASVYWAMCVASALPKWSEKVLKFVEVKILRSDGVIERKLIKFGDWLEERVDNLDLKMDSIGIE